MDEHNTIRENASELSSRIESKQIEALACNRKTLEFIDELQELKQLETGLPSLNYEEARKGLHTAAVSIVSERFEDDLVKARDELDRHGYPDILD